MAASSREATCLREAASSDLAACSSRHSAGVAIDWKGSALPSVISRWRSNHADCVAAPHDLEAGLWSAAWAVDASSAAEETRRAAIRRFEDMVLSFLGGWDSRGNGLRVARCLSPLGYSRFAN